MSFLKKYFSYLNVIPVRTYESVHSGRLEINWLNGKKILDTKNTNYSYGNLGKVLKKALKHTETDFISKDQSVLILGLGGGDVIKQLRNNFKSQAHITAIEIDPVIIEIAFNEFDIIPNSQLEIINNDAYLFLKYTQEKYDVIIVDLFNDTQIPEFVFQNEFIKRIHQTLNLNGTAIFNTFILNDTDEIKSQKFLNRLQNSFLVQSFKKVYGHNHLIITQKTR